MSRKNMSGSSLVDQWKAATCSFSSKAPSERGHLGRMTTADQYRRRTLLSAQQILDETLLNADPFRVKMGAVLRSDSARAFMSVCVFFSIGLVVRETDLRATDDGVPSWIRVTSFLLLGIYALELVLRLYVSGHKFFMAGINVMDLLLVSMEVFVSFFEHVLHDFPNLTVMRFFRLIRIARLSSFMMRFRPLYLIVHGFFSAMEAMVFGAFLLAIVLAIWSIFAVELLHPISEDLYAEGHYDGCERCASAYGTVLRSMFTFIEVILMGGSWDTLVLPYIARDPKCAVIFIGLFVTVQIGMMNLILAVIVDSATKAHEDDELRRIKDKEKEFEAAIGRFEKLCAEIDTDKRGEISQWEFTKGLHENKEFVELLIDMDISSHELGVVFTMMDVHKTGRVTYRAFAEMFHRLRSGEVNTHVLLTKHYVKEIFEIMNEGSARQQGSIIKPVPTARASVFRSMPTCLEFEPKEFEQPAELEPKASEPITEAKEAPISPRSASSCEQYCDRRSSHMHISIVEDLIAAAEEKLITLRRSIQTDLRDADRDPQCTVQQKEPASWGSDQGRINSAIPVSGNAWAACQETLPTFHPPQSKSRSRRPRCECYSNPAGRGEYWI